MAIILGPPPPLETLILSLLPPLFLPLRDEEAGWTSVLPVELANWRQLIATTISQIAATLDEDDAEVDVNTAEERIESRTRLAEGVARWDLAEAEDEDTGDRGGDDSTMDGWIIDDPTTRKGIKTLLARLPPPSLGSLRPIFSKAPPPAISTSSFRPMARPVINDSVHPDRELWKENVGWGCWNVLRNAINGCDGSSPPPLPLILPPLLTLVDDASPSCRLRGLYVVQALLRKCKNAQMDDANKRGWGGPWLVQTGIGELILKSLSLTLHLPNSFLSDRILRQALTSHLLLTTLLYPPNTEKRTLTIDEMIDKGIVGTWIYRSGGEEGDCARVIASWLGREDEEGFAAVLGSLGVTRVFGLLLRPLLLPLSTLVPTSSRSQPFLLILLRTIRFLLHRSLEISNDRVAAWRGKVLAGVGRLWVAIKESELVEGKEDVDLEELKEAMFDLLALLAAACPGGEFLEELDSLLLLNEPIFRHLVSGTRARLDPSSTISPVPSPT